MVLLKRMLRRDITTARYHLKTNHGQKVQSFPVRSGNEKKMILVTKSMS